MGKPKFQVSIEACAEVHELPDAWPVEKLRAVLELADFSDPVTDEEAPEMAAMALADLDAREASELVLEGVFGAAMSPGVRQNVADDLEDDRPWEQFAGVDKQAGLFNTVVLLQRAFPTRFAIPDALRLRVLVRASNAETSEWLRAGMSSALMLRLLASGMDDDAILKRLYESDLEGDRFPDADAIVWRLRELGRSEGEPAECQYEVWSSCQWFGPLEDRESFVGHGWPDAPRAR